MDAPTQQDVPAHDSRALLAALLQASTREIELLTAEDWEGAVAEHDRFEQLYAGFERASDVDPLAPGDVPLLQQLADSQTEAMRLARALQAKAGSALISITNAQPIVHAYAPMGATHKPGPRFLDQEV